MRHIVGMAVGISLLAAFPRMVQAEDRDAGKRAVVRIALDSSGQPTLLSESAFAAWTPDVGDAGASSWGAVFRRLAGACKNASLAAPEVPPAKDDRFHIELRLGWDSAAARCSIDMGRQVPFGYGENALRLAATRIEKIVAEDAVPNLYLWIDREVPCRWVVLASEMAKERMPGKIQIDPYLSNELEFNKALLASPAFMTAKVRLPALSVHCLVHPDAPFDSLSRLLAASAWYGVRVVWVGSAPADLCPLTLSEWGVGQVRDIRAGLVWLRNHQSPDGRWSSAGYDAQCARGSEKCGGAGSGSDWETTGLTLMAFLNAGHTQARGEFVETVEAALQFLAGSQNADGSFGAEGGTREDVPAHAVCVQALAEAYAAHGSDTALLPVLQKATDYLVASQRLGAGWGAKKDGPSDTVTTAWAVFALQSAKQAGLKVPSACFEGACKWFDAMTDPATGRVSLAEAGDNTEDRANMGIDPPTATAAATAARILCLGSAAAKTPVVLGGGTLLMQSPVQGSMTRISRNPEYLYFGTQAAFHLGGDTWTAWSLPALNMLALGKRGGVCAKGSWDPEGQRASIKGRVYITAINTLVLLVNSRVPLEKD